MIIHLLLVISRDDNPGLLLTFFVFTLGLWHVNVCVMYFSESKIKCQSEKNQKKKGILSTSSFLPEDSSSNV